MASRSPKSSAASLREQAEQLAVVIFDEIADSTLNHTTRKAWLASKLESALAVQRAEALREAADRMDDSDSETWTREEVRDWLAMAALRAAGRETER
jgi:hypothetical protein